MLTIEWQQLSTRHGYDVPEPVVEAGLGARFDDAMERSASLYDVLSGRFPEQAAYAVSLAYRMRYVIQMNAREAMHLCELRSSPQGHASYRRIAQSMHRLIAEQAGHRTIAAAMSYVDHAETDLERLVAEHARPKRDAWYEADAIRRSCTNATQTIALRERLHASVHISLSRIGMSLTCTDTRLGRSSSHDTA